MKHRTAPVIPGLLANGKSIRIQRFNVQEQDDGTHIVLYADGAQGSDVSDSGAVFTFQMEPQIPGATVKVFACPLTVNSGADRRLDGHDDMYADHHDLAGWRKIREIFVDVLMRVVR